jgi:HSP20 family molecular chaperone IbpA
MGTTFYWTNFSPLWDQVSYLLTRDLDKDDLVSRTSRIRSSVADLPKKQLSSLPSYPHCDCWVGEDLKTLNLEFALAGYSKDAVKVSASKNQLRIVAKSGPEREGVAGMIHNGISKKDVDFSLSIDESFNVKKAKTNFCDGMLQIEVPRAKDAEIVELM